MPVRVGRFVAVAASEAAEIAEKLLEVMLADPTLAKTPKITILGGTLMALAAMSVELGVPQVDIIDSLNRARDYLDKLDKTKKEDESVGGKDEVMSSDRSRESN